MFSWSNICLDYVVIKTQNKGPTYIIWKNGSFQNRENIQYKKTADSVQTHFSWLNPCLDSAVIKTQNKDPTQQEQQQTINTQHQITALERSALV